MDKIKYIARVEKFLTNDCGMIEIYQNDAVANKYIGEWARSEKTIEQGLVELVLLLSKARLDFISDYQKHMIHRLSQTIT